MKKRAIHYCPPKWFSFHRSWFRRKTLINHGHSAASPLPQTHLAPSNCTAPFRNTSSRGSANSAVYAVTRGGAIKAGTNHRKHKITYLREVISTTSSLFLSVYVNSDAVADTYYKQIQRVVRGSSGFSVHVDMRSLFVVQYFCGGREGQFVAIEATITHWQYWLSLSIWRNILEWVLAHNWSICTLPLISNLTKIEKNWINNQPIWGLERMIIGEHKQ